MRKKRGFRPGYSCESKVVSFVGILRIYWTGES